MREKSKGPVGQKFCRERAVRLWRLFSGMKFLSLRSRFGLLLVDFLIIGGCYSFTFLSAAIVLFRSVFLCAVEMKVASNWDGGR